MEPGNTACHLFSESELHARLIGQDGKARLFLNVSLPVFCTLCLLLL